MAAMSPALADDGASIIMVLLVVLLAMMLVAVIRLPEWDGPPEQDARPQPAPAAPSRPADVHARAAATIARAAVVLPARPPPEPRPDDIATIPVPAVAASRPRRDGYAARHASGRCPGQARSPGRRYPAARHGNRHPSPQLSRQGRRAAR